MVQRISEWLRLGGYLLMNLSARDNSGSTQENWLGSKMYWSSFDEKENREMVEGAGFELMEANIEMEDESGKSVPFLWILAKKGSDNIHEPI